MRKGFLKVKFHIAHGPESLFERVHYKMDCVKTVGMDSDFLEQAKQRKIPQEVIDRIKAFQESDWELKACDVRMDTGKFVTSSWETEYAGESYCLTIGPENTAEDISLRSAGEAKEDEDRAMKRGNFYAYVRAVNRGLMEDARPMSTPSAS